MSVGGARNAGLLAVRILAAADLQLQAKLTQFQEDLEQLVLDKDAKLREKAGK